MKFNKDQREGLAKVADNLATASMVAAIVGGMVDQKIGWVTVVALVILCLVLLSIAFWFRKGDDNGD